MDDERLTSDVAPVGPSEQQEQAQPTSTTPQAENAQEDSGKQGKPNLFEIPEFREYQSQRDRTEARKLAELEQRLQSQITKMQEYYQSQYDQLATRDMPETDRAIYERDRALQAERQRRTALEQQMQQLQVESSKAQVLADIAQRTGAPLQALVNAESPDHAWALGIEHMQKQLKQVQQAQQQQERAQANAVDIGGGGRVSSGLERRFKEAKTATDLARIWFSDEDTG